MTSFIVFFLSFLANLLIIKMMPDKSIRIYINAYTIVGGCGALFFFLLYSRRDAVLWVKKIGYFLLLVFVLACFVVDKFWVSVAFYPLFLIYNDYLVTQSDLTKYGVFYRLFLILSAIPFLFFQESFELLFQLRIVLLAIVLAFYAVHSRDIAPLHVRSTWKYVFFNYTFYYAPLLLIANITMTPDELRVWYVFSQGGLVVYLKYLDFALRKGSVVSNRMGEFVLAAALAALVVPIAYCPSGTAVALYLVGLLGLIYSKRYINIATA